MAGNIYASGALVRLTDTVKVSGVLTDAAIVVFTVHPPQGADLVYTLAGGTVIRDSVGTYHCDVPVVAGGTWLYNVATTTPQSDSQGTFYVQAMIP